MASDRPLPRDVLFGGWDQVSTVTMLLNIMDLLNELQTDHATYKTTVDELVTLTTELRTDHATFITEQTALGTTVADYKAIYDAHTHECPGSSFAASRCSTPDTGAAENSLAASAASAFTDTSGSPPASITAPAATAGPAALTNSTAITNLRS